MAQLCFIDNFYLKIIIFIVFNTFINVVQVLGQTCQINEWCRPSETGFQFSNLTADYVFLNLESRRPMTWFEALEVCRKHGAGSELLSIESAWERSWVLLMAAKQAYRKDVLNDLLWHVNAHKHLYSSDGFAWANGQPLGELYLRRPVSSKNCRVWNHSLSYTAEEECFGLVIRRDIRAAYLVDLNCTVAYTYRAICKRPTTRTSPLHNNPEEISQLEFNHSEWMQSPRDKELFYRIFDLERESPGKANWYSARLLCQKYGAALLSDIRNNTKNMWLIEWIKENYRKENLTGLYFYFVDAHLHLYGTGVWSGPLNSFESYKNILNFPHEFCEPRLCLAIGYSGFDMRLASIYCGLKSNRMRAICERRFPLCINKWCRREHKASLPNTFQTSEYKFLVLQRHMNWFEALDECRKEGDNAELLSLNSIDELEQMRWIFQVLASQTNSRRRSEQPHYSHVSLWHVNAHKHLYHTSAWAWASGHPLSSFPLRTAAPQNCTAESVVIRHAVENECFGLYYPFFETVSPYLVDLNCTIPNTNRAICMRLRPMNSTQNTKHKAVQFEFNSSEWMRSPRDDMIYYRFFDLSKELLGNWYSARLLCKMFGAALTDIEDNVEFEWLTEQIEENFGYKKNPFARGTAYFVDYHRYLYGTNGWNWGTALKSQRSSNGNLLTTQSPTPDRCEPRLCMSIRYPTAPGERLHLNRVYCGAIHRSASAICKKRLIPLPKITNNETQSTDTSPLVSISVLAALFTLSSILLLLLFLSLCIARCLVARAFVRRPVQRAAAAVPIRGSANDDDARVVATSAIYGPVSYPEPFNGDILAQNMDRKEDNRKQIDVHSMKKSIDSYAEDSHSGDNK